MEAESCGGLDELAALAVAAFGQEHCSHDVCNALQDAVGPSVKFLRVSIRSGRGLFVSDNLLRPGPMQPSLVSLANSLAGAAMRARQPIVLDAAAAAAGSGGSATSLPPPSGLAQVWCLPSSHAPDAPLPPGAERASLGEADAGCSSSSESVDASSSSQQRRPVYVGALVAGLAQPADERTAAVLQALARALAPYLLILLLSKVGEMARLLALRAADAEWLDGEEEPLQDLPAGGAVSPPPPPPPPSGLLAGVTPSMAQAAAAAALAAAAPSEQQARINEAAVAAMQRESRLDRAVTAKPDEEPGAHASAEPASSTAEGKLSDSSDGKPARRSPYFQGAGGDSSGGACDAAEGCEWLAKPALACAPRAGALRPGPARHPLLLTFAGPGHEAAFAADFNSRQAHMDALFAGLCLAEAVVVATLGSTATGPHSSAWLLAALLALVACAGITRYAAWREPLVAGLLLAQALACRGVRAERLAAAVLGSNGGGGLGLGPLLGMASLSIPPLVWQLRLAVAIPVQLACAVALFSALPLPCGLPAALGGFSATAGCMPLLLAARLVAMCVLLPIIALYLLEGRSRVKWAAERSAAA